MRFSEFPFLRYVVYFILGVVIYSFFGENIPRDVILATIISIYFFYLILVGINIYQHEYRFKIILPILAYVLFVFFGLYFANDTDIKNQPDQLLNTNFPIQSYLGTVLSNDEAKPNSIANQVLVKKVFSEGLAHPVKGEVLIYHRSEEPLNPGDVILISGNPNAIQGPKNPNEFNYQRFMLRQKISHQHFISDRFEVIGSVKERPVEEFFIDIRSIIMARMDFYFQDKSSLQVAKALLLGQKKNLDKEVSDAYATAGAMHILAVSGLHVGIIYGFFFLFVKPFRLPVSKRVLYLSLIILLIWGYAMLTGMSPSVMRAATMFSLMALAQMKSRSPSIFNAIALSALILLILDPFLIYAVGFQLSYIALLGILVIQPMLVRLWLPKNRFLEYVWQISTVGIAAQLATFPISAYYFHIFPTYFMLSNLVAIPGAFLIMSFGVPFMVFAEVPMLSKILAWVTEKLIALVNLLIFWIQDLPASKITEISISVWEVVFYWLLLILFLLLWVYPGRKLGITVVVLIFIAGIFRVTGIVFQQKSRELYIYALNQGMAVDFLDRSSLYSFEENVSKDYTYSILPNRSDLKFINSHSLMAFLNEEGLELTLPDIQANLLIHDHQLILSEKVPDRDIFRWKDGTWEKTKLSDTLDLNEKAFKVRFK
ncbi:ComEC/Rec2 family competence protein [Aquiflexum lacus]|uniref:ComEC/Rec2 family competence protein n=1 Tax=Aquiflexum lacus TaxID=2483805 RepID=UPI001894F38E|nr:ComEC/Rec2 family competence protein [Aquiflexum lacus]